MRDKSTDETEPLPHAPYPIPPHSVRMFRWLCLLSDTTSGAAARLNPQWDDAPLKRVVGGFRDYSCGLLEMAPLLFLLPISFKNFLSAPEHNASEDRLGFDRASRIGETDSPP